MARPACKSSYMLEEAMIWQWRRRRSREVREVPPVNAPDHAVARQFPWQLNDGIVAFPVFASTSDG